MAKSTKALQTFSFLALIALLIALGYDTYYFFHATSTITTGVTTISFIIKLVGLIFNFEILKKRFAARDAQQQHEHLVKLQSKTKS